MILAWYIFPPTAQVVCSSMISEVSQYGQQSSGLIFCCFTSHFNTGQDTRLQTAVSFVHKHCVQWSKSNFSFVLYVCVPTTQIFLIGIKLRVPIHFGQHSPGALYILPTPSQCNTGQAFLKHVVLPSSQLHFTHGSSGIVISRSLLIIIPFTLQPKQVPQHFPGFGFNGLGQWL